MSPSVSPQGEFRGIVLNSTRNTVTGASVPKPSQRIPETHYLIDTRSGGARSRWIAVGFREALFQAIRARARGQGVEIFCRPSCPQNPRLAFPRLLHAETFRASERGAGRRREACRRDVSAGITRSQQESLEASGRDDRLGSRGTRRSCSGRFTLDGVGRQSVPFGGPAGRRPGWETE